MHRRAQAPRNPLNSRRAPWRVGRVPGVGNCMTEPDHYRIPGPRVEAGDHLCALYPGPGQRDVALQSFLLDGLRRGDKCLAVIDSLQPGDLRRLLESSAPGVSGAVASGQLEVITTADAYALMGAFSGKAMIDFWDATVGTAVGPGGYESVRIAGEMSWVLRDKPDRAEFLRYESDLNDFMPRYRQVALCLYDIDQFPPRLIADVLQTHPKLLIGGLIIDNPHFVPPQEYEPPAG